MNDILLGHAVTCLYPCPATFVLASCWILRCATHFDERSISRVRASGIRSFSLLAADPCDTLVCHSECCVDGGNSPSRLEQSGVQVWLAARVNMTSVLVDYATLNVNQEMNPQKYNDCELDELTPGKSDWILPLLSHPVLLGTLILPYDPIVLTFISFMASPPPPPAKHTTSSPSSTRIQPLLSACGSIAPVATSSHFDSRLPRLA